MFRIINDYISKVKLVTDAEIYEKMDIYLGNTVEIKKYCINISYNKYIVDIKLNHFSVDNVDLMFRDFVGKIAFPYSSMFVRYNEGERVRYRFVTSKEDKTAVYMDIIFS